MSTLMMCQHAAIYVRRQQERGALFSVVVLSLYGQASARRAPLDIALALRDNCVRTRYHWYQ